MAETAAAEAGKTRIGAGPWHILQIADLFQISTDRLMGAEFVDLLEHELADPERFKRVEARIRQGASPLKAV